MKTTPPPGDNFEQWRDSTAAKIADEITPQCPAVAANGTHDWRTLEYEGCYLCKVERPAETKTEDQP